MAEEIKKEEKEAPAESQQEAAKDEEKTEKEAPKKEKKSKKDAEIEKLKEELEKKNDILLRTAAEFDNYKKRTEREKSGIAEYARAGIIKQLLPISII